MIYGVLAHIWTNTSARRKSLSDSINAELAKYTKLAHSYTIDSTVLSPQDASPAYVCGVFFDNATNRDAVITKAVTFLGTNVNYHGQIVTFAYTEEDTFTMLDYVVAWSRD